MMRTMMSGISVNRRISNFPGGAATRAAYLLIILVAAGALAFPRGGYPASPPDTPAPTRVSAFQTSPVTIDGSVLFRVRGAQAFPAEERASMIGNLIEKAARDRSFRADAITVAEAALSTDV